MATSDFKEPQALHDVAQFHRLFKVPVLSQPTIPDEKRRVLRVNLLQEELNELKVAIEQKDSVEIADALADLQYVLSGAIHEFGLGDRFSDLFAEVVWPVGSELSSAPARYFHLTFVSFAERKDHLMAASIQHVQSVHNHG